MVLSCLHIFSLAHLWLELQNAGVLILQMNIYDREEYKHITFHVIK